MVTPQPTKKKKKNFLTKNKKGNPLNKAQQRWIKELTTFQQHHNLNNTLVKRMHDSIT
jgi:hypothetical protein